MKELNEEFKIKPGEIENKHILQMKNEIKENNNKTDYQAELKICYH